MNHGEHPQQTVVREVYEETGLHATVGTVLGVHDTHFVGTAPSGRVEDYHGIHLVFAATVRDGGRTQVTEADGTTDAVEWFPIADLADQSVLDVVRFAADLSDFLPPLDFPPSGLASLSGEL